MPKHNPNATIHSVVEFMSMEKTVEMMIVDNSSCNDKSYVVLDLSSFSNLKVFEVGDYSCTFVNEVKLIGLKQLENVVIGKDSFTKHKNSDSNDPNCHFYLKNCERLRELKMGNHSFVEYSVCEIENVPSLEVIEMGALDESSANFSYASLELKSDCERMK